MSLIASAFERHIVNGKYLIYRGLDVSQFREPANAVPQQSGAGPSGKVAGIFRTGGYDHQGSYSDEAMLMLTQHLIAKIVQVAK